MLNQSLKGLSREAIVEAVTQDILEKFSGLSFTMTLNYGEEDFVLYEIHDRDIFLSQDFRMYYLDLMENKLWANNILYFMFVYKKEL